MEEDAAGSRSRVHAGIDIIRREPPLALRRAPHPFA
jgi:hypothetical protein